MHSGDTMHRKRPFHNIDFREKGGVHWEGGFAFVRERERQKAVIKALHQVHHLHLTCSVHLAWHLVPGASSSYLLVSPFDSGVKPPPGTQQSSPS